MATTQISPACIFFTMRLSRKAGIIVSRRGRSSRVICLILSVVLSVGI
jgi:hypothetical protein